MWITLVEGVDFHRSRIPELPPPACRPHPVGMTAMPTPLATTHPDLFGSRHTLWLPLPTGADLDAAVGTFNLDTTSIVTFEDIGDGTFLMAVSVFTNGGPLVDGDKAALYGETAEAWCRATINCAAYEGPPVIRY